jgi:hypothetical protein
MKYALAMSTALLLAMIQVQPAMAQKNGNNSLVSQAIAAEGGADALRALKGVGIKADVKLWGPEQSESPGGAPRDYGTANLTITWDLARGMAHRFDRDQKYPSADNNRKTVLAMGIHQYGRLSGQPARQLPDVGHPRGDASA